MKKAIAALLAMVIVLLPLIPLTVSAEDIPSGVCGGGVTWRVETTFVSNRDKLTISGTGSMDDYSVSSRPPWEAYKDRIGTVIVESGVGRIGEYAFYDYVYLDYLIFHGDTPPDIAPNAFSALRSEGVIVHPEGKGEAYDIWGDTEIHSWDVREPGHTEPTSVTVKIPVAGESPDSFITGESWQYYYGVTWRTPNDPDRDFDGEYQAGGDYFPIVVLLNDSEVTGVDGGVIDYKNGILPLDGFTINGQPVELYTGGGPFELSSAEDIKITVTFRDTADFVPVTDIRDVPLNAVVGQPHTLSGTVFPDNATYKNIVWSIKDTGGTGAVLANDGRTITSLTAAGTVTVTATVPLGGVKSTDPEPPDPLGGWPYQDYTQDFNITVSVPVIVNAAPPVITRHPGSAAVTVGTAHTLTVEATSPDSGVLSYQWYENSAASNSGGTLIGGATGSSYTPPTDTAGIFYYYVEVTNTNNSVNGIKTASAVSDAATLTVSTVTGKIGYEPNDPPIIPPGDVEPTLDVVVSLWQNDEPVSRLEKMMLAFDDNVVRYYSFTGVGDGWYTVVADSYMGEDLFYTITRDVYVKGGRMADPPEAIIFTPGETQSILEIAPGAAAQNVATNDLPDLFETDYSGNDDPPYTETDREHLEAGGEVEFKLNVANAAPADQSLLSGRIAADGYSSVLFVDLTLTKTLYGTNEVIVGTPRPITNVTPALLEIVVPMTLQQTITAVYRLHEGAPPAALPSGAANANEYGEYFQYDAEKNTVYLYVNQFSAYAFAVGTGNGGDGGSIGGGGGSIGGGGGSPPAPAGAEDSPGAPQTGDDSPMGLWYAMLGVSVLGLAGLVFFYKRQRKTE